MAAGGRLLLLLLPPARPLSPSAVFSTSRFHFWRPRHRSTLRLVLLVASVFHCATALLRARGSRDRGRRAPASPPGICACAAANACPISVSAAGVTREKGKVSPPIVCISLFRGSATRVSIPSTGRARDACSSVALVFSTVINALANSTSMCFEDRSIGRSTDFRLRGRRDYRRRLNLECFRRI